MDREQVTAVDVVGPDEQVVLLALARASLDARVRRLPRPPAPGGGIFDARRSAFVTIRQAGELRGCLGRLEPESPLAHTIVHLGAAVADSDPRFPPVTVVELETIAVEISVLTPEWRMRSVDDIEIGRHGVTVELDRHRGLLLPQVAPEQGWDALTLLAHASRKAGLPPDAWRHGAIVRLFEAQVFGEEPPDERP